MKKVPSETIAGKRVIKRYLGSLKVLPEPNEPKK